MIELSWNGKKPLKLKSGEERSFLNDGDRVILKGQCVGNGYKIGFGDCSSAVLASINH